MSDPLLEIENLTVKYQTQNATITAVSDASFSIDEGEYFGLVGESGCGKSTLLKSIIGGLDDNGRITSGKIRYRGREIQHFSESELNDELRWKEISYIPQSSLNSLDPLQRISNQAAEIASVHTDLKRKEAVDRLREMFNVLGLSEDRVTDYPSQFSGGMQQRAIIALSLFLEPELVIADEPTTALDVLMQDQTFKYLDNLREKTGVTLLLITHDISLVFESCDKMAVMHAGQVAESGTVFDIYERPRHPYTILLKRAFPDIRFPDRDLEVIEGKPPELVGEVDLCTFADRCPWSEPSCRSAAPSLEPATDEPSASHKVACFRQEEVAAAHDTQPSGGPIHMDEEVDE